MSKLEPSGQLVGEAEEEDECDVLCGVLPEAEREADRAVTLGADGHHHEHRHALLPRCSGEDWTKSS